MKLNQDQMTEEEIVAERRCLVWRARQGGREIQERLNYKIATKIYARNKDMKLTHVQRENLKLWIDLGVRNPPPEAI